MSTNTSACCVCQPLVQKNTTESHQNTTTKYRYLFDDGERKALFLGPEQEVNQQWQPVVAGDVTLSTGGGGEGSQGPAGRQGAP